ncbi:hypothetical protein Tco_0760886 [Tanacetum coccineum]
MIEEEAFNLCSSLSVEKPHVQTAGDVRKLIYLSIRYKEAFKTDLEGSPPEATYERCKFSFNPVRCPLIVCYKYTILLAQSLLSGARSSETAQLTDHLCRRNMWISQKSLPRPLLSAAIVNPTKDEDTVMVQVWSLQAEYLQRRARRDEQAWSLQAEYFQSRARRDDRRLA